MQLLLCNKRAEPEAIQLQGQNQTQHWRPRRTTDNSGLKKAQDQEDNKTARRIHDFNLILPCFFLLFNSYILHLLGLLSQFCCITNFQSVSPFLYLSLLVFFIILSLFLCLLVLFFPFKIIFQFSVIFVMLKIGYFFTQ